MRGVGIGVLGCRLDIFSQGSGLQKEWVFKSFVKCRTRGVTTGCHLLGIENDWGVGIFLTLQGHSIWNASRFLEKAQLLIYGLSI